MLTIGTQKSDRITTITNTTWAEYISLDLPSKRVSFRNGVITIVSPGRNHELIGDYIRAIIWAYCRKNNLALFPYNQTTLKIYNCFDTNQVRSQSVVSNVLC
ncbi:MAG: hypothetical protein ACRC2S_25265 [Waterburya sp.]